MSGVAWSGVYSIKKSLEVGRCALLLISSFFSFNIDDELFVHTTSQYARMIGRYTRLGVEAFSNHNLDAGHMINCLNNHVEEVVVKGWFQLFKVIEALCGLLERLGDQSGGPFVVKLPGCIRAVHCTREHEREQDLERGPASCSEPHAVWVRMSEV